MAETRKQSTVVKVTDSVTEGVMSFNGVAESAGRANKVIHTDETISTEDHEITITNN